MGIAQAARYNTEVDCSGNKMIDTEYTWLMQSLNLKVSCVHIIQAIDTQTDQMYIFIEGGARVGKMQVTKAIYQFVDMVVANVGKT